jgi:hypothetical protein
VSVTTPPEREDVLAMLAMLSGRDAAQPSETIDSMELAWLVQQVEQRNRVVLDLGDDELARMSTVDGAVGVLREALTGAADV